LINDSHDIESLGDCWGRSRHISRGHRGLEHIESGGAVSQLQVRTAEPTQRGEPRGRMRVGVAHEVLVQGTRIVPASVALGLLGARNSLLHGG
jgi:hypothetical protein